MPEEDICFVYDCCLIMEAEYEESVFEYFIYNIYLDFSNKEIRLDERTAEWMHNCLDPHAPRVVMNVSMGGHIKWNSPGSCPGPSIV